jgi:hypothetical protein
MSDGILTITGFGRFEKLHAEYSKLVVANQKLQDQLKKVTTESKKSDDAQERSASKVVDGIGRTIAMYGKMLVSIEAINSALQKKIDLEQRAAARTLTVADAQVEFSGALGLNVDANFRRQAISDVTKFGLGIGVRPEASLRGMAQVLNSVTESDPAKRMRIAKEIFSATAPYFPSPEQSRELGMTAASIGDIHKGVPGASVTDISKIAFGILGASRLSGPDKLATVGQAIVAGQTSRPNVKNPLENTRQMAALVSALGLRMGDADGELARTAGSNLAVVFSEMFPDLGEMPIMDAIQAAARNDKKKIEQMKKKVLGKSFTKEAQKDLLIENSVTDVLARVALGELDVTDKQLEDATEFNFSGTPEIAKARSLRIAGARQDAMNMTRRSEIGAIRSIIFGGDLGDENLTGALNAGGGMLDFIGDAARRAMFEVNLERGINPREAGIRVLRDALEDMDQGFFGWNANKRDNEDRAALMEAIDRIGKLPAVIEEQTNVMGNAQHAAAAAAQRGAQTE